MKSLVYNDKYIIKYAFQIKDEREIYWYANIRSLVLYSWKNDKVIELIQYQ